MQVSCERQTDGQTHRRADRQQTDRQTDRQTEGRTERAHAYVRERDDESREIERCISKDRSQISISLNFSICLQCLDLTCSTLCRSVLFHCLSLHISLSVCLLPLDLKSLSSSRARARAHTHTHTHCRSLSACLLTIIYLATHMPAASFCIYTLLLTLTPEAIHMCSNLKLTHRAPRLARFQRCVLLCVLVCMRASERDRENTLARARERQRPRQRQK